MVTGTRDKMKLITEVTLMGEKITIDYVPDIPGEPMTLGCYEPVFNTIKVRTMFNGKKIPKSKQRHVLAHELAHAFGDKSGMPELFHNEQFCDLLGAFILQIADSGI